MSTRMAPKRRGLTDDGKQPVKRKRKSNIFVEYQPSVLDGEASIKKSASAKRKSNTSSSRHLSCAECRRLKLKCDRVFPCQPCIRRGCQGICPSGSLVSGKGTRYVLASTEQLHEKISQMSDRIRQLEVALQALYEEHYTCMRQDELPGDADAPSPRPVHPLLQDEMLLVKDHFELYAQTLEQDSSRRGITGDLRPLGDCADNAEARTLSEDSARLVDVPSSSTLQKITGNFDQPEKHQQTSMVPRLDNLFWPMWKLIAHERRLNTDSSHVQFDDSMLVLSRAEILEALPLLDEAERLCYIAQEAGFFVLNYILTDSEIADIMHHVYDKQRTDVSMIDTALLFVIFSIGLHVDCSTVDSGRNNTIIDGNAENYISISRAAMTLHALASEQSAFAYLDIRVLQYHFLLMQVLAVLSSRSEHRQQIENSMSIVVALVKIAGIDLENSYSQYTEAEQHERRYLFYEILSVVGEICLALDFPASFCSPAICRPPASGKDARRFPTQLEADYYEARRSFYINCLKPVLDARSAPPSQYSDIIELDCKIRTFPFPPAVLQDYDAELVDTSRPEPSPLRLKLLRFITTYRINSVLLHLHRKFMQQCLGSPNSVLAHPYFASVVATSRSAWVLVRNCDAMHRDYPELVNRLAVPWYNVFCAGAALFILLERMPYCPMSPFSLRELLRLSEAFDKASATGSQVAGRASPIVRQFAVRGAEIVRRWRDILASELCKDPLLQSRSDYCLARFDAIVRRIKQGNNANIPSSFASSSLHCTNDPVSEGLEIWDIAHSEIGEVLMKLPSYVIDQHTSDEALWETVRLPIRDKNDQGSGVQTPLMEIFDALDHQLRRRPDFIMSAIDDQRDPSLDSSTEYTSATRDMFPDDLDLDWAALTDALASAPVDLTNSASGEWVGFWDWRHTGIAIDENGG